MKQNRSPEVGKRRRCSTLPSLFPSDRVKKKKRVRSFKVKPEIQRKEGRNKGSKLWQLRTEWRVGMLERLHVKLNWELKELYRRKRAFARDGE